MESPLSTLPPISAVLSPSPPESDGTESTASSQPYDEDALDALMGRCEHLSARLAAYERELEVKLAAAAADLDAQRDYSAQLADRCQVAERRAAEAALALSKSIAEQDLLIKRYARQGAGAAAKAVSPLGAFNE